MVKEFRLNMWCHGNSWNFHGFTYWVGIWSWKVTNSKKNILKVLFLSSGGDDDYPSGGEEGTWKNLRGGGGEW